MLEKIMKVNVGEDISKEGPCIFCGKPGTKLFGILDVGEKRWNGIPSRLFRICETHLKIIDSFLDGSEDINRLKGYNIENSRLGKRGLNLRAVEDADF